MNIKQEEWVFSIKNGKKGKTTTQKCTGQTHALILNYVGNVAESLSEIEDESGCDDEVNIIWMKNKMKYWPVKWKLMQLLILHVQKQYQMKNDFLIL